MEIEGLFTSWIMKLSHNTSMVRFLKNCIHEAFGPLSRCIAKVDQEAEIGCADFFKTCSKKAILNLFFFMFDLLPFRLPSFLVTMKDLWKNNKKMI